jgi:hypothetical protein
MHRSGLEQRKLSSVGEMDCDRGLLFAGLLERSPGIYVEEECSPGIARREE